MVETFEACPVMQGWYFPRLQDVKHPYDAGDGSRARLLYSNDGRPNECRRYVVGDREKGAIISDQSPI